VNKSEYQFWDSRGIRLRLFAVVLACCIPFSFALSDDWHFSDINRVVAVSDIHGAYDALVSTFQEAAVINQDLHWIGGDTHLVITGDLLDRGPGSRQVMDLVMRLEREAKLAGGQVHQLLGNHEVMNLNGDVRYVSDAEYAAFSDDESTREREYWYQQFKKDQPLDADEQTVRAEFDQKAPPGFFGHRRAFRSDGVYGKWLLEKPLMVVVNDTAFVHGGAPPFVAEHGLAGVNVKLKADLSNYLIAVSTLEDASVLSPVNRYRDAPAILKEKLAAGELDEAMTEAAQAILELRKSPLNNSRGPMWYRGTARCNRLIEGDDLNAVLDKIGAKQIVIGHTPTSTRRVQQRMSGRVIEIDTGMLKANYHGSGNALIFQDDLVTVANEDGADDLAPIMHPMGVGHEPEEMDDETLEKILTNGVITETDKEGSGGKLLQIVAFDRTVFAYFNVLSEKEDSVPEIAAYRLDRMLGLYMVPVTVRRHIDGMQGTLQYAPAETINEHERVSSDKGGRAVCSMPKQHTAMYVFDSLIHNPDRGPESMLYDPHEWQLMLIDHQKSFGTPTDRPAYLKNTTFTIGNEWRASLVELNDERLQKNLGDVLDKGRLAALGERRDMLIKDAGN
jgi:hypothetical protein